MLLTLWGGRELLQWVGEHVAAVLARVGTRCVPAAASVDVRCWGILFAGSVVPRRLLSVIVERETVDHV